MEWDWKTHHNNRSRLLGCLTSIYIPYTSPDLGALIFEFNLLTVLINTTPIVCKLVCARSVRFANICGLLLVRISFIVGLSIYKYTITCAFICIYVQRWSQTKAHRTIVVLIFAGAYVSGPPFAAAELSVPRSHKEYSLLNALGVEEK